MMMKQKIKTWIFLVLSIELILTLLLGCKKETTIPLVETTAVSDIAQTIANCGGTVTSDGGATVTMRGVCWSINQLPTIADSKTTDGTGIGNFTSSLTGLASNSIYYVRAYATNSAGTGYGTILLFTTLTEINQNINYGIIKDQDSNTYKTVTIGTQTWMAENLKTTHYRNGVSIPNITDPVDWYSTNSGAYSDYDNEPSNSTVYGRLYNYYAVMDTNNLCPSGWHVPSKDEWNTLFISLGGKIEVSGNYNERVAGVGGKMKEAGNVHWENPNTGADNSSGFTALPGGWHSVHMGEYDLAHEKCFFWSTTLHPHTGAYDCGTVYDDDSAYMGNQGRNSGFSVRCVKD